jgi:hypothetical protein
MASNKVFEQTNTLVVGVPAGQTLTSNQPVMFGTLAGVCDFTNPDPVYPNPSNLMTIDTAGGFTLTASALSSLSPSTGSQIRPGDQLYADGGTRDAATGILYGFTLDKNTGGIAFGRAMTGLASGTTGTVTVRLN